MWHTSVGDRVVKGAEAALMKAAISEMAELLKEEAAGFAEQREYGVKLFDQLPWVQRLLLLERVATYLFTETPETLELTAVLEAAVATAFEHVRVEIDWEIDTDPHPTTWRERVLAAYKETSADDELDDDVLDDVLDDEDREGFSVPTLTCDDHDAWNDLVECLADNILWDRDFDMQDMFLDAPPENAEFLRTFLGIDDDYFSAAPPDVTSDSSVMNVIARLDRITASD